VFVKFENIEIYILSPIEYILSPKVKHTLAAVETGLCRRIVTDGDGGATR
jgi:hypothetical protein